MSTNFTNLSLNQKIQNIKDIDISGLRYDVDQSFNAISTTLTSGLTDLRNDVDASFTALRSDVDTSFTDLRSDIDTSFSILRDVDISNLRFYVDSSFERVDGRIDDLSGDVHTFINDLSGTDGRINILETSMNLVHRAVFEGDLSSIVLQNALDISDNKIRIENISRSLFDSDVSLTALLDRSNEIFSNLDPSYNILERLQTDMKHMRINLQVEGEMDISKVVFSTGMGGPIEDLSGNLAAYGIPVLGKSTLDEVMITSRGYIDPSSQPISFILKAYDASGTGLDASYNIDLDTNYKVDTDISLAFENKQNQLVIVSEETNLDTWHPDSRFRFTFAFSKDPVLTGSDYYTDQSGSDFYTS